MSVFSNDERVKILSDIVEIQSVNEKNLMSHIIYKIYLINTEFKLKSKNWKAKTQELT